MKKAILSAVVVFIFSSTWSQQDPQYSNFMYDKLSVNPGSAGMHNMFCGTVMYRSQWMGFDGAPKTILFNADGYIPLLHGGVGLTFYNDKLGFERNNIIRFSYSYHQNFNFGKLGGGLALGYAGKSFAADWQYIDPGDAEIPANNEKDGAMDMNLGVYWQSLSEATYAGLSVTHLNGADLSKINLDIARHYWFMAGHWMQISAPWSISGDMIVKSDLASTQFDLAVRGWFKKEIYAGVSYRHQDAIFPMVGITKQLPTEGCEKMFITAGAAYDITLSEIKDYSSGSVDFFVKFCFKPCRNEPFPKPVDVRFLGT